MKLVYPGRTLASPLISSGHKERQSMRIRASPTLSTEQSPAPSLHNDEVMIVDVAVCCETVNDVELILTGTSNNHLKKKARSSKDCWGAGRKKMTKQCNIAINMVQRKIAYKSLT